MKDKKWVNCPSCGSSNSMQFKKNVFETYQYKNEPKITIGPLSGYFCKKCNDGIFNQKSSKLIKTKLTEHRARCDAKTTPASALMLVKEASQILKVTRQAVYKMMKEGKIESVFIGDLRLPKRKSVIKFSECRI